MKTSCRTFTQVTDGFEHGDPTSTLDIALSRKEEGYCQGVRGLKTSLNSKLASCPRARCWETYHVEKVYNLIAPHYNDVKHKKWPKVNKFLKNLAPGTLVADIGCGNGRYLSVNPLTYKLGSDICSSFLEQARSDGYEIIAADNMTLPYRDGVFDAVCSIGVIHHFSSQSRRIRAVKELARIASPGSKVMIYVWAYEQTRRKFTSQDVLIPWFKPEHSGKPNCRLRLAGMEGNINVSVDNSDSQDEQLDTESAHDKEAGLWDRKGISCTLISPESSLEQQSADASSDAEWISEILPSPPLEQKMLNCVYSSDGTDENCLTIDDTSAIDERDIEWTPQESDSNLHYVYPNQLVAECKKLGRLLRHFTNKNESRYIPDLDFTDNEDMFADSYQGVSETLSRLQYPEAYCPKCNENGSSVLRARSGCSDDDTCQKTSLVSNFGPFETSLMNPSLQDDSSSHNWDSFASESIVLPSSSADATTLADDPLDNDISTYSSSSDTDNTDNTDNSKLLLEQTESRTATTSKRFCPFSMTPPEVPSDTSIYECSADESNLYPEVNTHLLKLNSNSRDVPCIQNLQYYDRHVKQANVTDDEEQTVSSCEHSLPDTNLDIDISTNQPPDSQLSKETAHILHPKCTTEVHKTNTSDPCNDTPKKATFGYQNNIKNNSAQTNHQDHLYLFALRQNMKNVFTKIIDAFHVGKKTDVKPNARPTTLQLTPRPKVLDLPPRAKRADEITLQYYREVCYFPPNNQYQSMKACLGSVPAPKSPPKLIQGKRHGLIDLARRLSGKKEIVPQHKAAAGESRKLSLSDALTMIGDGYAADSIEDKLDSAAKKVFTEMKSVNFGIRQFPRSSVENEPPTKQVIDHLKTTNSLDELKETARYAKECLQNGLTKLGQDTVKIGFGQCAKDSAQAAHNDSLCNGLSQVVQSTIQNGLTQIHQSETFSVTHTAVESLVANPGISVQDKRLLFSVNVNQQVSTVHEEHFQNRSNNAACDGLDALSDHEHCNGSIMDTLLDVKSLPGMDSGDSNSDADPGQCMGNPSSGNERNRIISSLSRYYHVFRQGELEELIQNYVPSLAIVETYYDHANWCVIAQKL
ncbi:uncharacterized protein LOC106067146 [Biomphalaria glabrata]|uniref:Uncharacterized protein LOC106067146 n=1 Tax=Biomphalaria glabrata TaxID=6526 RepID=A0A9W3B6F5_BIOGL|nr:uncharacterized protein LOC106067146 [Biomphalaria glabrata]